MEEKKSQQEKESEDIMGSLIKDSVIENIMPHVRKYIKPSIEGISKELTNFIGDDKIIIIKNLKEGNRSLITVLKKDNFNVSLKKEDVIDVFYLDEFSLEMTDKLLNSFDKNK